MQMYLIPFIASSFVYKIICDELQRMFWATYQRVDHDEVLVLIGSWAT